jgi:beta-glucosidase
MTTMAQPGTAERLSFPLDFVWGAATAAYQIEGGAGHNERGACIWDTFSATPGKVFNAHNGAVACDHYHLWRDDIKLMQQLQLPAYRFSISWPRVFPQGNGQINERGLDFYDRLVDGLLEAGITPYATLYHWDLPQALEDKGGWANRDTAYHFAAYSEAVLRRIGDRVRAWATHNEPWCAAVLGYQQGYHAPGHTDPALAMAAMHHILLSHGLTMPLIRQLAPRSEAGIVLNLSPIYPDRRGYAPDEAAARRADCELNRICLDPLFKGTYPLDHQYMNPVVDKLVQSGDMALISQPLDYLGINYYSRQVVAADPDRPGESKNLQPSGVYTTMGWEVYPNGLYDLLRRLQNEYPARYYITENGSSGEEAPDAHGQIHDELRLDYFQGHLAAVHRAIQDGVNLGGYFAWSLMDNFEWSFGYSRRFGLVYVDYPTQRRTLKQSGKWYAGVIAANGL